MRLSPTLAFAVTVTLVGCRPPQRYIAATLSNRTDHALHTLEFDYPSASFGTQTLASNADFHYRFLIQGPAAPGRFSFTDPTDPRPHDSKSPFVLSPGDEGALTVVVSPSGEVIWTRLLAPGSENGR